MPPGGFVCLQVIIQIIGKQCPNSLIQDEVDIFWVVGSRVPTPQTKSGWSQKYTTT